MKEHKKKILLVEDEALIAMTEKIGLEKSNYEVLTVSNGEKAIDIARTTPNIDLILMDIDLGQGIDGTEAAKQILDHRDIPIVFLSSHTEPEVVEKTEKITSYGYVVKNTGIVVLDASIKMAMKLFDAKMEQRQAEDKLRAAQSKLSQELEVMKRLHHIASLFVEEENLPEIMEEIVETALFITGTDKGSFIMCGQESTAIEAIALRGFDQEWLDDWNSLPELRGSCGKAIREGHRVIVEDITQSDIFFDRPELDF